MSPAASLFATFVLFAPLARAQIDLEPTCPVRNGHALAFDGAHQRTVMVGGESGTLGVLAEVRVRQAGPWQRLAGCVPPAVSGHGMVCMPSLPGDGSGLLLFGGIDAADSPLDATWLFDGQAWSAPEGGPSPSPRREPLMAFDPVRNVAVLHGGKDANNLLLSDTWEWGAGNGWVQVQASGPPAIASRGMAFHPVTGKVTLVTGGSTGWTFWELTGGAWTQTGVAVNLPLTSYYSVATHPLGSGIVVCCGANRQGDPTRDVWLWNGSTCMQVGGSGVPGPQGRIHPELALDATRGRLVLHGGIGVGATASARFVDTWEWDGARWWCPPGASEPPYREQPGLVRVTSRGTLLLHGGAPLHPTSPSLDDTWERVGGAWYPRGTGPRFRGRAICYDSVRDRVVLFDGTATHEHDGTSWQQIPTPAQPPSTPMDAMAFHAATGQSLLCNGQTWIWDGANWTRLQPAAQPPPVNALAYDSRRAQIVALVFSGSPPVSSTWIWDGVSWTQPSAPGPTASPSAFNWWSVRMSYDENRDRTVAAWSRSLGGAGSVDLWEWDGAQWTSLGTTPVQVQGGNVGPLPALAYEAASQRSILHSGCETWLLTSPYPASVVPFGQGCAGLRGIPALTHSGPGPWLGSTFSLDVVSGNGTTPLLCVLGTNPTMWASQPLPMGLSGFGMSGCLLYTDVLDLRVLSGSRYTLAIPNAAGLAGFGFYNQALVQDPGSNTANWVMTNATRSVIGRR